MALRASLETPITDLASAKKWIEELQDAGLMFHFDDSVEEVIWDRTMSVEDLKVLDEQRNRLYTSGFEWGKYGCPIGYALHVIGHKWEN